MDWQLDIEYWERFYNAPYVWRYTPPEPETAASAQPDTESEAARIRRIQASECHYGD